MSEKHPKVSISYCWTSQPQALKLYEDLRANGVDATMDIFDLAPGQNMYHFMEKLTTDEAFEKILVLCDKSYQDKANNRQGGVGAEVLNLSRQVYKDSMQTKIIPVMIEDDSMPHFLDGTIYIPLNKDWIEGLHKLLRLIYNAPENEKAALGKKPAFLTVSKKHSPLASKAEACLYSLRKTPLEFNHHFQDYLSILSLELKTLSLNDVIEKNEDFSMIFENHMEVLKRLTMSAAHQQNQIYVMYRSFLINLLKENDFPVHLSINTPNAGKYVFVVQCFYYLMAFMFDGHDDCYEKIPIFTDHNYQTSDNRLGLKYDFFSRIANYANNSIKNSYKDKENLYTPIGDIINKEAPKELVETIKFIDFLFFLRSRLFKDGTIYTPITYPYWGSINISISSFKSNSMFARVENILNIKDYNYFINKVTKENLGELATIFKGSGFFPGDLFYNMLKIMEMER